MLIVFCFFLYFSMVIGLIMTRITNKDKLGLALKILLGMQFVIISLSIVAYKKSIDYVSAMIIIGLICNAIGDVFLGMCRIKKKSGEQYFVMALIIIGISQIAYLLALLFDGYFIRASIFIAVVPVLILLFIGHINDKLNKKYTLVLIYAYIITTVLTNACFMFMQSNCLSAILLGIGYVLFFVSDLILFYMKFFGSNWLLEVANKGLYYTSELLIACSIFY